MTSSATDMMLVGMTLIEISAFVQLADFPRHCRLHQIPRVLRQKPSQTVEHFTGLQTPDSQHQSTDARQTTFYTISQ